MGMETIAIQSMTTNLTPPPTPPPSPEREHVGKRTHPEENISVYNFKYYNIMKEILN